MPVKAEVRHYVDAEQADMVRGSDNISTELTSAVVVSHVASQPQSP